MDRNDDPSSNIMARLAFRPPLSPASSPPSPPSAKGGSGAAARSGTDDITRTDATDNSKTIGSKMKATTTAGSGTADDSLSLEGDVDDANSTASIEDYDLGFLDDMACGVYRPIRKLWGVQAIAGLIGEQCSSSSANNQSTDEAAAAANEDENDANNSNKKKSSGKTNVNSSLLQDSSSVVDDQSRRSITSSSYSEVSGDVETTTSINTSTNTSTNTNNTSIDIDVSADLDEIAQRQADLLYNELAQTRQEVLLQKQRSMKKGGKNKQGGGGIFKMGLLGRGGGGGGASKVNANVNATSTSTTPKTRRGLSLRKNSNNNHNKKSKSKSNKSKLNASADRPVLAVVNDSGIDLVNVSLQRSNDNDNIKGKDGADAGTSSSNDEAAKAVNTSGSTAGTGGSAIYSATLRPEGMDTSIDLVVKTGPAATGTTTRRPSNNANKAATATAAAVTTTTTNNKQGQTDNAKNEGSTTVGSAQAKLDAIATATDEALASVFFGPAAQAATAQAQYLVKAMQEDARRYYQEAVAAERGGDVKGAQKWYGLASMAQEREAQAKAMGKAQAMGRAEAEQSFMACGLEVQMAPSTLTDGRSVGSTTAFDDEDEDDDDGGTFVSITSNDYTHQDGAGAVDNKGTGIRSDDLGLGGITSFGGGEASTGPAHTPAHVRPAATTTTTTCTTTARGAKATSTSFTVEDPTFVLEMSSIDEMMASFSTDAKPEASQKQEEKPAVSQMDKNKKKPTQPTAIVEDEPPLERSDFVTPVFNLLVRAYGAENFSGNDRWERVNVILDSYKGREDRLIQSLLTKAAERETKQKKEQKQLQEVGVTGNKSGAETNITGTPSDSFQLDVSSIAPEAAATSSTPSEAPQKPDLSFRDLAARPVDDDDSVFGDLEQNAVERVDNAGPSACSPPTAVNALALGPFTSSNQIGLCF